MLFVMFADRSAGVSYTNRCPDRSGLSDFLYLRASEGIHSSGDGAAGQDRYSGSGEDEEGAVAEHVDRRNRSPGSHHSR